MDSVTVLWSGLAAVCLTLAGIHFLIWCRQRSAWANLLFALIAGGTAGMAACELGMMMAPDPATCARWGRWIHGPAWLVFVSLSGFIHFRLGMNRLWLPAVACGLRTLTLLLNFTTGENLNFLKVTGIRKVSFLGGVAGVPVGVPNPAMILGQLTLVLLLVWITMAAVRVWRQGRHGAAFLVGICVIGFVLASAAQSVLVYWGILPMPLTFSLFFSGTVLTIGYELSTDLLRANEVAGRLRLRDRELQESQERLNLAAQSANAGFWSLDAATGRFWSPPLTLQLFGFPPDRNLTLEEFLTLLHPEDRPEVSRVVASALASGQPSRCEYRVHCPDGSVRWFKSIGRSQTDRKGKVSGLTGITLDVTTRKEAEIALFREKQLTQAVFDAVPGLLFLYNQQGQLLRWNRKHEELTGYSTEELGRMTFSDWLDPHDLEQAREEWDKVFSQGSATTEVMLKMKDGHKIPFLATGVRLELEGMAHMVGIAVDISEQKRLEMESHRHLHHMARMSRVAMLGEMSATIAHEINQPLGAILSNAETAEMLLDRTPLPLQDLRQILGDIRSDDLRASEVIQRVRSLVSRRELNRVRIPVKEVVQSAVRLMAAEARHRGIELLTEPGMDPSEVMGDRVQLEQVLVNLMLNGMDAMKQTPAGHRLLRLGINGSPGSKLVRIEVADSGSGIDPSRLGQIFESYFTTKSHGMGLGLALARSIAEAHSGSLSAANRPEGGAVFTLTLGLAGTDNTP